MKRCAWFLTDLRIGGAERLPLTLMPEFRAFAGPLVLFKDRIEQPVPEGLPVVTLGSDGRRLRDELPSVLGGVARASRDADVLIGGMEGAPLVIAALRGMTSGTPVVGVIPTHIERLRESLQIGTVAWSLIRMGLQSCRAIITASEDARDSLIAVGVRPERVRWIPNPVSPWAERIERVAHPGGAVRILTVGRLEAIKGMDVIVEAVQRLGDASFVWEIVGPGPDEEMLRGRAAALGITDRLKFLGRVPDLAPIFARADLFVLASRVEGLSIAMLEAMAAGIPVVATRSGRGVEDALRDRAGMIVPVEDPVALADAVAGMIADPERRRSLGARGRERAREFSASAIAARYEQVLLEVTGGR